MSWLASLLLHVVTLCRQYASYGASIIPVNLAITPHGYESTCLLPRLLLRNHSFLDRDIDLYAHRHTHTKTHVSVASTNNTYINAINCKRTISSLMQVCLYSRPAVWPIWVDFQKPRCLDLMCPVLGTPNHLGAHLRWPRMAISCKTRPVERVDHLRPTQLEVGKLIQIHVNIRYTNICLLYEV